MLHEIAHHLCDAEPPHGPEFVATFCELAEAVMGPEVGHVLARRIRQRGCAVTFVAWRSRIPKALDELFNRVLHTEDDALTAAREAGIRRRACRRSRSPPNTASCCSLLATAMRATRVLEIGTLAGYSTIQLARAVGPGGQVVTLEFEPKHAEVARKNFARAGVDDRVEVIVGAALDTLPTLAGRGEPFDLIFIDADKENNVAYVEWAIKLGAPGSIIVVDNIARFGRVLDPAPDDLQARAVRDMLEMMGANPRLEAAAIQTVGTKGWDGFAVAIVKEPVE